MRNLRNLLTATALTVAVFVQAQQLVPVGRGSYASYTPLANCRSTRHAVEWGNYKGDQSDWMQRRTLYINERDNQPIPTNDWWTNLITEPYSGHLWSYPQMVQAQEGGIDVQRPSYWIDNGTEMKSNTVLTVSASDFHPAAAIADQWHDWDVAFTMTDGDRGVRCTLAHGMPFTWMELTGAWNDEPVALTLANSGATAADFDTSSPVTLTDAQGNAIVSGSEVSQLVMTKGTDSYGVYLPSATTVTISGSKATLAFNGSARYIVVAMLNSPSDLTTLSPYAYTVPRKTTVSWNYLRQQGKMQTFWDIEGESLNGVDVRMLQGFLPHQYRDTGNDGMLTFTDLSYATPHGRLKMAEGTHFEVDYNFYGMLPYWGVPTDTTGVANPFDPAKMATMIAYETEHQTFGNDTYWGGKSLTQMALNMMMAREMNDSANFVACRDKLKAALVNWYTFTPGEESMFFARYDRWGGLVGYNTSYDSDTFNDHHFHYGYFAMASALLALVDKDFRDNYGQMARLVVKDYANWDHADTAFPFFRTLDPWAGHSFAGGMGDGNGNGQESSSEAMQGWGGMYLLGVALGDDAMRDAGLFGWLTEARGTAEYWFDRHTDLDADYTVANYHRTTTDGYNIPYSKFSSTYTDLDGNRQTMTPPYNSNLTCHGVGWWTYFGFDAIYMQGIQWMPISPALDYLSENKQFAAWDYQRLMQDKLIGGWSESEKNSNGWLGASGGWGNVTLSYLQRSNPDEAARLFDELYANANSECAPTSTVGTNGITYFVTHSHRSHGDLSWKVTADWPTARCFDHNGTPTYQVFNPTDAPLTVTFSTGYKATVPAHELFISDAPDRKAVPYVETTAPAIDLRDSVAMENIALGKTCYESGHENVGTVKKHATDGDLTTRWGSLQQDDQWIYVDLGKTYSLYKTKIYWEAAYASEYKLQVSDDAQTWHDVKDVTSTGGTDEVKLGDVPARYLRVYGVKRATNYGISLYELEVYGQAADADATALIGLKVTGDRDVLKEGQPSQLSVKGLTAARTWQPIAANDVSWSSRFGDVTAAGVFTPDTFGIVSVGATYGNIRLSQTFAVEEARVAQAFAVTPGDITMTAPDGQQVFTYGATDQFIDNTTKTGAPIAVDADKVSVRLLACGTDTVEATANQLTYDAASQTLTTHATGDYLLAFDYGGLRDTVRVHAVAFTDLNLALHKPVTTSSVNGGNTAANITDGSATTRWESDWSEAQSTVTIDLQQTYQLSRVRIDWEGASAATYDVLTSKDGVTWAQAAVGTSSGAGWTEDGVTTEARYVRIACNTKTLTAYGYSLFEVEVYGTGLVSGIDGISVAPHPSAVYNLAGQRVNPRSIPAGIYISGGRKVISR